MSISKEELERAIKQLTLQDAEWHFLVTVTHDGKQYEMQIGDNYLPEFIGVLEIIKAEALLHCSGQVEKEVPSTGEEFN